MEQSLFRAQAFAHKKNSGFGAIVVVPKLRSLAMTIFLFIWLPLFTFWFAMSGYSKRETVTGWVYPESGAVKIFSSREGVVRSVFVEEGQPVKAGDPLLLIGSNTSRSESGTLDAELRKEYSEQLNTLQMQIDNIVRSKDIKLADIERKISAGKKKAVLLTEEVSLLKDALNIYSDRKLKMESLMNKGYLGKFEFENGKSVEMDRHVALKKAENELAELDSQNKSYNSERDLAENTAADVLLNLQDQKSTVNEKIFQLNNQSSILVSAETDGYVNNLQISKGQFVSRTNSIPLLTITPSRSKLLGQLFIPMKSSGFVKQGQQVRLKYDAFPYQKYGAYRGVLIRISDVAMLPGELDNAPIKLSEAGFLATVELPNQAIRVGGKSFPLKAGMTFSSDITLERRSLLYWFIEPLLSAKETFED